MKKVIPHLPKIFLGVSVALCLVNAAVAWGDSGRVCAWLTAAILGAGALIAQFTIGHLQSVIADRDSTIRPLNGEVRK